ncbi:putative porin [Saprospiraceae bacterium]|nr:putative porin [Saprospiraceae bacterium]
MGQRDQQRGSGNDPQSQRDSSTLRQLSDSLVIQAIDTLSNDIFAFTLDNLSERVLVNDTTLNQFEEYELTRGAWKRYSTLGNTGSSAHGTFWNPRYSDQFELGFNQHDPYKFKDEDIRYYKIEKPFSSVYFNPGETQSSFTSKAQLIRDFANGVSVSLNFNRINSQPYYQKQEVRHTSMQVGYFHKIDSSRFAYAINFRSNSNFEMYNGGITDRTLFDSTAFQFAELLPVNSEDEYSYQLSRDYSARVYYFLQDKKKSKQYLQLKVNHDRGLYKYINESVSEYDSITYTAEFTDFELGMRYPINVNKTAARLSYHLENNLLRSFYYVRYGLNQVRNDLGNQNISELVGGAENSFDWRGLNVNLDGYVGTVYNSFLLDLHPSAGYNYRDKAAINFGFRLHTQPSAYSVNQVAISFASIRDEDPFVVSSQELYGEVDVPLVGFKGRISSYTGQNVPVLDSTGTEFLRENITYLQVDLEEKISYKWFHFNNRFSTQIRSNEVYDMPLWYTEHELYFEGKLFEALEFQSGFNLDFVPSASLPSYSPLYGRFYNSNNPDEGFFYRLDTYAAIKVQGFRFFVKYENLNDLWQSASDKIYQVRDYPQFDGRLRLGVSWELRN